VILGAGRLGKSRRIVPPGRTLTGRRTGVVVGRPGVVTTDGGGAGAGVRLPGPVPGGNVDEGGNTGLPGPLGPVGPGVKTGRPIGR